MKELTSVVTSVCFFILSLTFSSLVVVPMGHDFYTDFCEINIIVNKPLKACHIAQRLRHSAHICLSLALVPVQSE